MGLDIGGATLKAATSDGIARSRPFPLWRSPSRLADEIDALVRGLAFSSVALTMTAELCDCFRDKAEGVATILKAVSAAIGRIAPDPWDHIAVWNTAGAFVDLATARDEPWTVAASNWLALATFAGRFVAADRALLIDVGSTTTDIIPLHAGTPVAVGRTDPERLASGELVYQGIVRTPLCAILPKVTLGGREYRTMAELFATAQDAYVVLGETPEDPSAVDTADGRPATAEFARDRIARMIGSDRTRFGDEDARNLARQVKANQVALLSAAITDVTRRSLDGRVDCVILSGQGEFLPRNCPAIVGARVISLGEALGADVSRAACAYAVAILWRERVGLR